MTKFKYLFFILFNICVANSAQESFLQANQLCRAGEFEKSIEIYEGIKSKGEVVWYNLGNCYFYQKDYIKAIWAWLQACQIANEPILTNSRFNINVALNLLGIKNHNIGYVKINYLLLQVLILIFVYLFLIFLLHYKATNKILGVSIFLLAAMIFGINFWHVKEHKIVYAVVKDSSALLAGPASTYHRLDQLLPGQILKIIRSEADWCYIDNGSIKGWVTKSNLLN